MTEEGLVPSSWHSPQSVYVVGHRAVADLFLDSVLVEEKVDGSFFAFGRYGDRLRVRSKGAEMIPEAPEKMFRPAVDAASARFDLLRDGWQYRGEFLAKPLHNALAYDRVPKDHVILFDVCIGHEDYLNYDAKAAEAARLGLEVVPRLFHGRVDSIETFRGFLQTPSVLGGQRVEGVVAKNYGRFGPDKKALFAKFVSEAFKETHGKVWRASNPNAGDIVATLVARYHGQARWQKAVQHLREAGRLEDSPRDIGLLFEEVQADIEKECAEEIRDMLWHWAWPKIRRKVAAGLVEWYKDALLRRQFEDGAP